MGAFADVDDREPQSLRSEWMTLRERPDGRGVGSDRAFDPAGQARREQADGRDAGCGRWPDVPAEHGLPVAGLAQGSAGPQHRLRLFWPLGLRRHSAPHHACSVPLGHLEIPLPCGSVS